MKHQHAPIRFLLPLFVFIASATLIAVPFTRSYINLLHMAQGKSAVHLRSGAFEAIIPRSRFLVNSLEFGTQLYAAPVRVLNEPANLLDIPLSRLVLDHLHNSISSLPRFVRETFTFPFFGIPFWWLVGAGLEVLLFRKRLHWAILLLGTICCALWTFVAFGFFVFAEPADRTGLVFPIWSFFLWAVLFSILPVAWVAQYRRSKAAP